MGGVVLEDASQPDPGVIFVAKLDERSNKDRQEPGVGGDPSGGADGFAGGQVQRPQRVAALHRDGRGRHPAAHRPGGVADVQQDLPRGLVRARVFLLATEFLQAEQVPRLLKQPLVLRQQLPQGQLFLFLYGYGAPRFPPFSSQKISYSSSLARQPGGTNSVVLGASITARPCTS